MRFLKPSNAVFTAAKVLAQIIFFDAGAVSGALEIQNIIHIMPIIRYFKNIFLLIPRSKEE
jgi:hypothetical protein